MPGPLSQLTTASRWLTSQAGGGTHLRSVGRGIVLAALVGLVAGLGAIAFHTLAEAIEHVGMAWIVGYDAGGPLNEAVLFVKHETAFRPWLLLVVPAVGGLIAGWLIYRFAPEAEGAGTGAAIDAYHNGRGLIRGRVPLVKMLASAVTLGTGGSGGREGPIAQIGAGFGSYLATRLGLGDAERRILLAAGLGAGIGAIFQAPLAGAIFAIEVLYRDADFEAEALIPAFIATTVAYCIFNVFVSITGSMGGFGYDGFGHLFEVSDDLRFRNPLMLAPLTMLALVTVIASAVFVRIFRASTWSFRKLAVRPSLKPAIGGFLTGAVALSLYYAATAVGSSDEAGDQVLGVLGFGYGLLQDLLSSGEGQTIAIGVLIVVAIGKMLTTSLTIGSGGAAGVFGPSMVIGGSIGAAVGLAFSSVMPAVSEQLPVFVILGMASFFAATAKTPVSTLIMVSEMTGSYELLLPSMWVCAIAYLLSRNWTIYAQQVNTRRDSAAHRGDFLIDVLQGITVADTMQAERRTFITVPLNMPMGEVVRLITGTKQTAFPVVDAEGHYYGLFGLNDVRQFLYDSDLGDLAVAHDLASPEAEAIPVDTDLGSAIERFATSPFEELPVVDPDDEKRVIGMLRRHDVIATYNARLMAIRADSI